LFQLRFETAYHLDSLYGDRPIAKPPPAQGKVKADIHPYAEPELNSRFFIFIRLKTENVVVKEGWDGRDMQHEFEK